MKTKLKILLVIVVAFVSGYLCSNSNHPFKDIFPVQIQEASAAEHIDCPFEAKTTHCFNYVNERAMAISAGSVTILDAEIKYDSTYGEVIHVRYSE